MPHLQRARDHIDRIAPDLIQLRSPDVPGEYVAGSGAPIETVNGATKWQGYGWISERPDTSSAMNVASQLVQEDTHTVAISIDALPEPGDIIEILSAANDPGSVGFIGTVTDTVYDSTSVRRRIGVRSTKNTQAVR